MRQNLNIHNQSKIIKYTTRMEWGLQVMWSGVEGFSAVLGWPQMGDLGCVLLSGCPSREMCRNAKHHQASKSPRSVER